tara:strand:- start:517 stop:1131 length:615 start_codon:yes stop_codon:yes gene_type:complete
MVRTSNSNSSENNIFETNATSSSLNSVSTEKSSTYDSIEYVVDAMTQSNIVEDNSPRVDFVDRAFINFHDITQSVSFVNKSIVDRIKRNSTFRVLPDIANTVSVEPETSSIIFDSTDNILKYYNGTEWISSDGSNPSDTWEYLVYNWSSEPTLNTAIVGGDVYDYELDGVTRYRFVPNPYDSTQDAFYSDFDGTNLTNLIVTRG